MWRSLTGLHPLRRLLGATRMCAMAPRMPCGALKRTHTTSRPPKDSGWSARTALAGGEGDLGCRRAIPEPPAVDWWGRGRGRGGALGGSRTGSTLSPFQPPAVAQQPLVWIGCRHETEKRGGKGKVGGWHTESPQPRAAGVRPGPAVPHARQQPAAAAAATGDLSRSPPCLPCPVQGNWGDVADQDLDG